MWRAGISGSILQGTDYLDLEVGGSSDLTRAVAVYAACVAFALTYLLTVLQGGGGFTAALRGGVVALVTLVIGRLLIRPVVTTVLDAMARDKAAAEARAAAEAEEDE